MVFEKCEIRKIVCSYEKKTIRKIPENNPRFELPQLMVYCTRRYVQPTWSLGFELIWSDQIWIAMVDCLGSNSINSPVKVNFNNPFFTLLGMHSYKIFNCVLQSNANNYELYLLCIYHSFIFDIYLFINYKYNFLWIVNCVRQHLAKSKNGSRLQCMNNMKISQY